MNKLVEYITEKLDNYEKILAYTLAQGNSIQEFCMSTEIEYADNKNELENIQLKKITKRIKEITFILQDIIDNFKYY